MHHPKFPLLQPRSDIYNSWLLNCYSNNVSWKNIRRWHTPIRQNHFLLKIPPAHSQVKLSLSDVQKTVVISGKMEKSSQYHVYIIHPFASCRLVNSVANWPVDRPPSSINLQHSYHHCPSHWAWACIWWYFSQEQVEGCHCKGDHCKLHEIPKVDEEEAESATRILMRWDHISRNRSLSICFTHLCTQSIG